MISLFDSGRYSDSLFFGHIVLEKVLKAHVVRFTKQEAPYTHNLIVLSELVKDLPIVNDDTNLFAEANQFNIRARYPDYKRAFYKKCTREYTFPYFDRIKTVYQHLCQQLTQKNSFFLR